jgi:hypothetical protein
MVRILASAPLEPLTSNSIPDLTPHEYRRLLLCSLVSNLQIDVSCDGECGCFEQIPRHNFLQSRLWFPKSELHFCSSTWLIHSLLLQGRFSEDENRRCELNSQTYAYNFSLMSHVQVPETMLFRRGNAMVRLQGYMSPHELEVCMEYIYVEFN